MRMIATFNHAFHSGKNHYASLRPGLQVDIFNQHIHQSFGIKRVEENPLVNLAFAVQGAMLTSSFGVKDEYEENPGESYLFYIDQVPEIEQMRPGPWRNVRVRVAPDVLRSLSVGREQSLPRELQPFLQGNNAPLFHRAVGKQTSAMRCALQQLLQCPLQGVMRQVYLEGKVLELIALQFSQLVDRSTVSDQPPGLKPDDRDRIHQAKDILLRNLSQPPSVLELARQVELNEFKLRQGFHELFGTTVFGYLRQHQMQEAQRLLLERQITVAGVAATVGYASRTAFNAAFSKQFGMSPKQFQRANRLR